MLVHHRACARPLISCVFALCILACWTACDRGGGDASKAGTEAPPVRRDAEPSASAREALLDWEPQAAFDEVERRLVAPGARQLGFRISATSAMTAELQGAYGERQDGYIEFRANGRFGDQDVTLDCVIDQQTMLLSTRDDSREVPVPKEARKAIWIGMQRMGFLHNLARFVANKGPDWADGGIEQKVLTADHRWLASEQLEDGQQVKVLAYSVLVSPGPNQAPRKSAEGRLFLHDRTALPLQREMAVQFPGGVMNVRETYRWMP